MAKDNEEGEESGNSERRPEFGDGLISGPCGIETQKRDEGGEGQYRDDGGEGDVAVNHEDDDEHEAAADAGERVDGPETQDDAEAGGDAFAAFEAEVEGEIVSQDAGDGGEKRYPGGEEVVHFH